MNKVTGIKSVDFKVTAFGHGVVNSNGPTELKTYIPKNKKWETKNNHTLPKLRGFSNTVDRINSDGEKYTDFLKTTEIDFEKTPLYISKNCIRHHLFFDHNYDQHFATTQQLNLLPLLCSVTGLIRGYAIPGKQFKRTTALLLEDFICKKDPNIEDSSIYGNFEQFSNSSSNEEKTDDDGNIVYKRGENSIFSKTTFGDTYYESYGSINIEQLQFISLDTKFDNASLTIRDNQIEEVTSSLINFLNELDASNQKNHNVTFHPNFVRNGSIYQQGQTGILLNEDAIDTLVETTLAMIEELVIRQSQGYMYVDSIERDYNNSHKMMRIKRGGETNSIKPNDDNYAVYFTAVDENEA